MDANKSWKRTEEREINLVDMLRKLCVQWKQILVCAVVFACLLGGYRYMNDKKAAEAPEAEVSVEDTLTPGEKQQVTAAVELSKEIELLQSYLDESIVMNIDPYQKNQVTLLYSIEDVTKRTKQKVLQSYLNYLTDGNMIKEIKQEKDASWDIQESYLAELISAWQITDSSYQIVMNEVPYGAIFAVGISGRDGEMAEQLAEQVKDKLAQHYTSVKETAGEHKLSIVSTEQGIQTDDGLATKQHDKRYQLSTNLTSLKVITDAFSEQQKLLYEDTLAENKKEVKKEETEEIGFSKKWIAIGFVGGIAVYACIFACLYLLRDTVKSVGELKDGYLFPIFGSVGLKKGTEGSGKDLAGKEKDRYEREKAQMLNRIRLACRNQELSKIYFATDFSLNEQEKKFMEAASKQMKDWGIDVIVGENMAGNVSAWDALTEAGNVLMIYKMGITTHQMIEEEMNFYMENNVQVVGAVLIESY